METVVLVLVISLFIGVELSNVEGDYGWRDFAGTIPSDAVELGKDRYGQPVYVGQVLHDDKIIPGQIYQNDNKIYYEWGYQGRTATQNVKILCSKHPYNFMWVPVDRDDVIYTKASYNLVEGGYDPLFETYIGRVEENGATFIGKGMHAKTSLRNEHGTKYDGLFLAKDGTWTSFRHYQILAYRGTLSTTMPSTTTPLSTKLPSITTPLFTKMPSITTPLFTKMPSITTSRSIGHSTTATTTTAKMKVQWRMNAGDDDY